MHPALSPAVLAELRRPRPYPAVSILMPTHRREPDNAQDPVRLRNLLAEAKERIQADPEVSRADRIDVIGQLDKALTEVDLVHAEDGLAILAAPGEHQVWSFARTAPARVVLSDTFLTRNLVSAQAAERPYWVLAVAADRAVLWSGDQERVSEETVHGFPLARTFDNPDPERRERIGDTPSTFRDEETKTFLRQADTAIGKVLAADPRPLYVVGDAPALALLDAAGPITKEATAQIPHGGLAQADVETVRRVVGPAVRAHADREIGDTLARLDKARGRQAFAAGLDEVWKVAAEGRIASLAVEENYRATVRDDGDHLVPAEADEPGAREDIVDEVIERALDTGARITFVPDGTLADSGRIAADLRF
ncbi:chemotaxis protein [Streptomyces sp. CBMA123]|uniref:baeRF3 domain-containing protein n=1 Tax=Streptomyces sp. CBMA123 TaxID=1896313 RepID=UPI001661A5E3|nr:chemotaxis protein [Streptomyces sp. CBMA123]MBD0692621.1 chemotaxis protein [Streptomyces sp. CBMA123]